MSTGTNKERLEQNNKLLEELKTEIDNLPDASSEILTKDENGVCVIENKINSAVVYGNSQQDENIEVVNNQLTLKQSGKNLFDIGIAPTWIGGGTSYSIKRNKITVSGRWFVGILIKVKRNTNYYISAVRNIITQVGRNR